MKIEIKQTEMLTGVNYTNHYYPYIEGILPKGPYPPWLRMADRALLAGYPRYMCTYVTSFFMAKDLAQPQTYALTSAGYYNRIGWYKEVLSPMVAILVFAHGDPYRKPISCKEMRTKWKQNINIFQTSPCTGIHGWSAGLPCTYKGVWFNHPCDSRMAFLWLLLVIVGRFSLYSSTITHFNHAV